MVVSLCLYFVSYKLYYDAYVHKIIQNRNIIDIINKEKKKNARTNN